MDHSCTKKPPVIIREVWEHNLEYEFFQIKNMTANYPYVSIDTEYPGVIYQPLNNNGVTLLTPDYSYSLVKANVDATKMIQLGLTLSDSYGNLPHLGTNYVFAWQFNFREFDANNDVRNPASIELLKTQGINFADNQKHGVNAVHFSQLFNMCFGPQRRFMENLNFTWVTFHGTYDFAYLIKLLTRSNLPSDLGTFMNHMNFYFGAWVYDLKVMLKFYGMHGGLKRMAELLEVERAAGKHHQAGSDSLLTMQMFIKTKEKYVGISNMLQLTQFRYKLFGLNLKVMHPIVGPQRPNTIGPPANPAFTN